MTLYLWTKISRSVSHFILHIFILDFLYLYSLWMMQLLMMDYESEKVAHSCPTLWDPRGLYSSWILQARILEWVAFPFSRGSSPSRDQTQVSCIAGDFFTSTKEAQEYWSVYRVPSPGNLPDPGIDLGSPALQADSLPTELSGKPMGRNGFICSLYQPPYLYIPWKCFQRWFPFSLFIHFLNGSSIDVQPNYEIHVFKVYNSVVLVYSQSCATITTI